MVKFPPSPEVRKGSEQVDSSWLMGGGLNTKGEKKLGGLGGEPQGSSWCLRIRRGTRFTTLGGERL